MKVRMKKRPTGYVSIGGGPLTVWPNVDAVVDFPDEIAEELIASGSAEKVSRLARAEQVAEAPAAAPAADSVPAADPPVETRPAPTEGEEKRTRRPASAK